MKIEYTLEKVDFLKYQLYAASKSASIIKSRKKSRLLLPIVYFVLGVLLFVFADLIPALIFFGVGIAWYLIYPYYMKNRYIRHFEKYIDENYKNRFGKLVTLEFEGEYIIAIDYIGESRLRIKEIAEINEIQDYIFLKFSSGESLILPKDRIENTNELLTKIVSNLGINYNIDLNWQWK